MGDGRRSASPSAHEAARPGFLQPAYDLGTPLGRRPPRLPSDAEPALPERGGSTRGSPELAAPPPATPHSSSRASSPLQRRLAGASPSCSTPRGSSRGASPTRGPPSSAGSSGIGGLGCTSGLGGSSGSLAGSLSRPGTGFGIGGSGYPSGTQSRPGTGGGDVQLDAESARRLDMLQQGYLPTSEYVGIMALNKELREQNKRLHAELVAVRVEHERLRMEEDFLRGSTLKAGLEPPPEVRA
mmetsp:Transcript_14345/g.32628  ORF Transcript_14345/g.32628 Transcript_14345/m.32628 type:complete len:241 (-) Transcript_14345:53-775(-)